MASDGAFDVDELDALCDEGEAQDTQTPCAKDEDLEADAGFGVAELAGDQTSDVNSKVVGYQHID
jgi:hypothetical protein